MLPHLVIPKLTLQVDESQYWQVKTQCEGKFFLFPIIMRNKANYTPKVCL